VGASVASHRSTAAQVRIDFRPIAFGASHAPDLIAARNLRNGIP
jgi:hypothetical protein